MAKANTDQAYQHPFVVQSPEQFQNFGDKDVICAGIGNAELLGIGVKIGIPNFYGNACRELVAPPQLVGQIFSHGDKDAL